MSKRYERCMLYVRPSSTPSGTSEPYRGDGVNAVEDQIDPFTRSGRLEGQYWNREPSHTASRSHTSI